MNILLGKNQTFYEQGDFECETGMKLRGLTSQDGL